MCKITKIIIEPENPDTIKLFFISFSCFRNPRVPTPHPLEEIDYKLENFILLGCFLGENKQRTIFSNVQVEKL